MNISSLTKPSHKNISGWISSASTHALTSIQAVLADESTTDPTWFKTVRKRRLRQLATEIFTLKLVEVSKHRWSETDFEGKNHSYAVTAAIDALTRKATHIFNQLAFEMEKQSRVQD